MSRLRILSFTLCALLSSPAAAQSVKVIDPSTGLPVFSAANPASVTVVGSGTTQVVGNVASGAADSGNPVKTGGKYLVTPPTLADGNRGDTILSVNGATVSYPVGQGNQINDGAGNSIQFSIGASYAVGVLSTGGYSFNGANWDRARGDTNGMVVQSGLSSTFWSYSNGATGILSNTTTAVTIKAAAGASVRNYIDSCQINTTAFTASVPIAIRDGAGGTILAALNVPTSGFLAPVPVVFQTPLKGTANTLLEVVTTTANVTGTAWVNCQGHTGS